MSNLSALRLFLFGIILLVAANCAKPEVAGKPGVDETTNGISAYVVDSVNMPVKGARIEVRPCIFSHDSVQTHRAFTNDSGRFQLDTLPPGRWCLQVRSRNQGAFIPLDSVTGTLGSDSLHIALSGTILGHVPLPPSILRMEIQVLGLTNNAVTDLDGYFRLDSLPEGNLNVRAVIPGTDTVMGVLDVNVQAGQLISGLTLQPPMQASTEFTDSLRVIFNTTATGAKLVDAQVHVPILLRLDQADFPLSASKGGVDLRAFSVNGTEIPMEIQSWDATAQTGRIWVLIDTLFANDSIQHIVLRWGNRLAVTHSAPQAVFDTADGWDLVWHLSHVAWDSTFRARIPDATAWQNDGKLQGMTLWQSSPLGMSLTFDGTMTSVTGAAPNVELGRRSFTMGFWVQTDIKGAMIFSRRSSTEGWNHHHRMLLLGKPAFPSATIDWFPSFIGWGSPNVYATCSTAIDSSSWVHLTLRRTMQGADSGLAEWYKNGEPIASNAALSSLELDDPKDSLYLGTGALDGLRRLRGSMAEFRISRIAQSEARIRLDYLNQAATVSWIKYNR